MTQHIAWLTLLLRTDPPPGYYDDYHRTEVERWCTEGRWTTAALVASSIWDATKRAAAMQYIAERERS